MLILNTNHTIIIFVAGYFAAEYFCIIISQNDFFVNKNRIIIELLVSLLNCYY